MKTESRASVGPHILLVREVLVALASYVQSRKTKNHDKRHYTNFRKKKEEHLRSILHHKWCSCTCPRMRMATRSGASTRFAHYARTIANKKSAEQLVRRLLVAYCTSCKSSIITPGYINSLVFDARSYCCYEYGGAKQSNQQQCTIGTSEYGYILLCLTGFGGETVQRCS